MVRRRGIIIKIMGINSRLDEIQAAILRVKLKYLDKWNEKRRKIAGIYDEGLKDVVKTPLELPGRKHVYHLYVIRTGKRDELMEYLKKKGISTFIHYPVPVHLQKSFRKFASTSLPITEKITRQILSLPMYPHLRNEEVGSVITEIRELFS